MTTHSRPVMRILLATGLAVMPALVACQPPTTLAPSQVPDVQAGETIPVQLSIDGQEVYSLSYTMMSLGDQALQTASDTANSLVPVLTAATYAQADYPWQRQPVDPGDVHAFVHEWQTTIGGQGGFSATDLLDLMADHGADVARFLTLYRQSRLSLIDYVRLLTAIGEHYTIDGTANAVLAITEALDWYHVEIGHLVAALAEAAGTGIPSASGRIPLPEATTQRFFQSLSQNARPFAAFLDGYQAKGQSLAEAIRQQLAAPMATQALDTVAGPFRYQREWSLLPVHMAGGAIVTNAAPRPDDLRGCINLRSAERRFLVGAPQLPLVDYRWHWTGDVLCHSGQDHRYVGLMHNVTANFTKRHQSWPWDVAGTATMHVYPRPHEHRDGQELEPYGLLKARIFTIRRSLWRVEATDVLAFDGKSWPHKR